MYASTSLTPCRECQRLSHCQLTYMKVILAYVGRCSLWDKLIYAISIVTHFP